MIDGMDVRLSACRIPAVACVATAGARLRLPAAKKTTTTKTT
jgi:hypothetical protein